MQENPVRRLSLAAFLFSLSLMSGWGPVAQAQVTNPATTTNDSAQGQTVEVVTNRERTEITALTNTPPEVASLSPTNASVEGPSASLTNGAAPTNGPEPAPSAAEPSPPPPASGAELRGSPRSRDYTWFRLISDRNIFNPNRSSRRSRGDPREFRRPARVESFVLVGTMNYEKGPVAFFDGSGYQFRKALKPEETIAGYKLLEILHSKVKLAAGSNVVELNVGGQMRREDEGDWVVSARSEPPARPSVALTAESSPPTPGTNAPMETTTSDSPAAAGSPGATAASGGDESEVLKRLMQRREQEMSK